MTPDMCRFSTSAEVFGTSWYRETVQFGVMILWE